MLASVLLYSVIDDSIVAGHGKALRRVAVNIFSDC